MDMLYYWRATVVLLLGLNSVAVANVLSAVPSGASGERWAHFLHLRGGASVEKGYSFSLTTFSPRGSLSQIEYAMNAALVRMFGAATGIDPPF